MEFGAPFVLPALLLLPVVWWLLKLLPPPPQRIVFPGIYFLRGLDSDQKQAQRTPPWLLLLRMAVLALIILALADPSRGGAGPLPDDGKGAVVFVVDNGWEAAVNWKARQDMLTRLARRAGNDGRAVFILPTALASGEGTARLLGPFSASEAGTAAAGLKPRPWAKDYARVMTDVLDAGAVPANPYIVFLSDGFEASGSQDFLRRLSSLGRGLFVADAKTNAPLLIEPIDPEQNKAAVTVSAARLAEPLPLTVEAFARDGRFLASAGIVLRPGALSAEAVFDVPAEVWHRAARLAVREKPAAATTFLLETGNWRPAGILADPGAEKSDGYLSDAFYLKRALEPFAEVTAGGVDSLLAAPKSVIFWPDGYIPSAGEAEALGAWVAGGGHLVRFAGPNLEQSADARFLPVVLRGGGRNLGGALVWSQPQKLAAIDKKSALYGLDAPTDVTVDRQVLAEPVAGLEEKTLARLADGTPLVTSRTEGRGRLTLVHTTAGPQWSNLSLSGFYVSLLRRFVGMGAAEVLATSSPLASFSPVLVLDGFGSPEAAGDVLGKAVLRGDVFSEVVAGPQSPPGFYAGAAGERALNLAGRVAFSAFLSSGPAGFDADAYTKAEEMRFKPWLLLAALALFLIDTAASLYLSGAFARWGMGAAAAFLLVVFAMPAPARADEAAILKYGNHLHFGWIRTGDAEQDAISENGVNALCQAVSVRTSAECKGAAGLSFDDAALPLFPFVYWPLTGGQPPLTEAQARGLRHYLDFGGLLLIDTRDRQYGGGQGAGETALRRILAGIEMPPLMLMPSDHILSRAFYLLSDFPGRWTGGAMWVEKTANASYDNAPALVVGENDWAAAWAMGVNGDGLYALPGGARQRELAIRLGVNLAMIAMTGSYKSDQVHLPHILERLGR